MLSPEERAVLRKRAELAAPPKYTAAAHPQAILALLDALEAAERRIASLCDAHEEQHIRAEAAEAKVAALEQELAAWRTGAAGPVPSRCQICGEFLGYEHSCAGAPSSSGGNL